MKYYIVAGEASGDLHGSNLMKALYLEDENATIRFWGGDLMQEVGGTLVSHYKDRAFMGLWAVIKNLFTLLKFISFCKDDIAKFKPDVVIFIDNSGFNLRIAKWAKKQGFRTNYYISPQVWASRAYRVKKVKKYIDDVFVIFPFVKDFYKKYNVDVHFVGHPLLDAISNRKQVNKELFEKKYQLENKPIIALLPGSRKQEIEAMLSVMLSLVDDFSAYQFVIAGAPSLPYEFYKQFIGNKNVKFIDNKTYDLLSLSTAALVTSGTATLETAMFKVPQVVCYKTSMLFYNIAKLVIQLKFISLVNLILDREVVTELIQDKFNTKNLKKELTKILDKNHQEQLFLDYYELEQKLGSSGASKRTAQLIVNRLKNTL